MTGGGTGLGLVTAIALAQNGAKVYISGRRLAPIEEAAAAFAAENGNTGGKIIPVQADASDKGGIQSELGSWCRCRRHAHMHGVEMGTDGRWEMGTG